MLLLATVQACFIALLRIAAVSSRCTHGEVRLNGGGRNWGRVEICWNGVWGTVCDEYWVNSDASVLCQHLGFSPYGAIATRNSYIERNLTMHIIDFNCTGDEHTLLECPYSLLEAHTCNDTQDASVKCQDAEYTASNCSDGDVRLVGGSNMYEGRLEICINRMWGTVCSQYDLEDFHEIYSFFYHNYINYEQWQLHNSRVVCRQLGHQDLGSVIYLSDGGPFGHGTDPIFITNVGCRGNEANLLECPISYSVDSYCTHNDDVAIRCEAKCATGTARLVSQSGSYFRSYGTVEVCLNGTWNIICGRGWNHRAASVVCHQLGYSRYGAVAIRNFIRGTFLPLASISCSGREDTLLECSAQQNSVCFDIRQASIICQDAGTERANCTMGDVRLAGSHSPESGRLEVCLNKAWGTVCNNYYWDIHDADVACRQLGFQEHYGSTINVVLNQNFSIGSGPIFIYESHCGGLESSFGRCLVTIYPDLRNRCTHFDDVMLNCVAPCIDGDVQLYGSPVARAGLVRICVNRTWGKVCGGESDAYFASTVCSQLGFSPYGALAARRLWQDRHSIYRMQQPTCLKNTTSIWNCNYSSASSSCNSRRSINNEGTSIICLKNVADGAFTSCIDGSVRISGESSNKGRLEICRASIWGSVCPSRGFSRSDANVACRMIGQQPQGSRIFTTSSTNISPPIFAKFDCSPHDLNFNECANPSGLATNIISCGLGAVGVECLVPCEDRQVRLVGSSSFGRVEVCVSQRWSTICSSDHWDDTDAGVVCKQLGFSRYGSLAVPNLFSGVEDTLHLFQAVECNGTEESIFDCQWSDLNSTCYHRQDASVICQVNELMPTNCTIGDVRLIGGATPAEGRIEICISGVWASICSYLFYQEEANVVCSQLGYLRKGSVIRSGAYYGQGAGPVIGYFSCRGYENSLHDCNKNFYTYSTSCSHSQDVGVECEVPCNNGTVRLAGRSSNYQGRVEVCVGNIWGTVCADFWDTSDTMVVCKQLGFSATGSRVSSPIGESSRPLHIIDVNCTGDEDSIWDCPLNGLGSDNCNSGHYNDASLSCGAEICANEHAVRLVSGSSEYEGCVEICDGVEWGTACSDDNWGNNEAAVVCRQLGFTVTGATVTTSYQFGRGRVHFSSFNCTGNEKTITSCLHSIPQSDNCLSHLRDAGVICRVSCINGQVRLAGNHNYDYFGRVEVCMNGIWGKVCNNLWSNYDASVVCTHLGFSSYGAIARSSVYQQTTLDYFLSAANCKGNEQILFSCNVSTFSHNSSCTSAAGVICQASVSQPSNCTDYSVRLDPPNGGELLICYNGVWGAVCSGGISSTEANLLCHQLGFQNQEYQIFTTAPSQSDTVLVSDIDCYNRQDFGPQCRIQFKTALVACNQRKVIALECEEFCSSGDIRLHGTEFIRKGVVEICVDRTWGTICADYWDNHGASVTCRQLGFSPYGAIAIPGSHTTNELVHIYDLNCKGSENNLFECMYNSSSLRSCNHQTAQQAAVLCQPIEVMNSNCSSGDLRIRNESKDVRGRLELCDNRVWFSMVWHPSYWSDEPWNKELVCTSLGHRSIDSKSYSMQYLDQEYIPIYPFHVICSSHSKAFSSTSCSRRYQSSDLTNSSLYFVGIECKTSGEACHNEIRIVGAQHKTFGRIEVCINGTWGTICNSSWNDKDAGIVCKQLGFSIKGAISFSGHYDNYNIPVLMSKLRCFGNESSLFDCSYDTSRETCNRGTASIICQENPLISDCMNNDVRLIGGSTPLEGTVEVCRKKVWGGVCDHSWDYNDANVVCSQLGFQSSGSIATGNSFYGRASGIFYMTSVQCTGAETKLTDCSHSPLALTSCGEWNHAGVICIDPCEEGSIHLRGSSAAEGRVEICIEHTWTTICDDFWDNRDASVLCRQLGFSPYGALATNDSLTERQLSFGITQIHCNGSEQNISSCNHSDSELYTCGSHTDASVICLDASTLPSNCSDGSVRLVGGTSIHEGRIEVCVNQVWATVCDFFLTAAFGNVVCKQLGYLQHGNVVYRSAYFGRGSGPILRNYYDCDGFESSLSDCQQIHLTSVRCNHFHDAGIRCEVPCADRDIRLGGSSLEGIGRIEVCLNASWGSVCSRQWSYKEASVVCKQLGFSSYGSLALTNEFVDYSWPTLLFNVNCTGQESSIWQCISDISDNRCSDGEDTSVICQSLNVQYSNCSHGSTRLVDGESEKEGRVEVCYGNVWGSICDTLLISDIAGVICGQLGFQKFGASTLLLSQGSGPVLLRNVRCRGSESSLLECTWSGGSTSGCTHASDLGIRCRRECIEGDVRISGTRSLLYGAIEVCVNDTWVALCSDGWDNRDAGVVCRQLRHSPYGSLASDDFFIPYYAQTLVTDVNCRGDEISLLECEVQYLKPGNASVCITTAGVLCQATLVYDGCEDGELRLEGSSNSQEGRVEICINNAWGTICDNDWNVRDGNVVCAQLGFQPFGSIPRYNGHFGIGPRNILTGYFQCSGHEYSLHQCRRNDSSLSSCRMNQVAGIQCQELCSDGMVRIGGDGSNSLFGRAEVCVNRTWGVVCGEGWNDVSASVFCQQIGHSPNGAIAASGDFDFSTSLLPVLMSDVACSGYEESLFQCSYKLNSFTTCSSDSFAGILCQDSAVTVSNCSHGDVRLTAVTNALSGRVEVCINGVWGAVCDNGWDTEDANVACGQLGYLPFGAIPHYGAFYGESPIPLLISDLSCSGIEEDLLSCSRDIFGVAQCKSYEEAGVKCLDSSPVSLSKGIGSLLGGERVIVDGMSVHEADRIKCSFGNVVVDGLYMNDKQVVCVNPPAKEESTVEFTIEITRANQKFIGGSLYQYISPYLVSDNVRIATKNALVWILGEEATISWSPSSLAIDEVITIDHVRVDLSLSVYNSNSQMFEEKLVLATDLPNSGIVTLTLPESIRNNLTNSHSDFHVAIVRVGINSSTTTTTKSKQLLHDLDKFLSKIARYSNLTFISSIKSSITSRLLCEAWTAATPPFPTKSIPPCPCKEFAARNDYRFQLEDYPSWLRTVLHPKSKICFKQANVRDFNPGQQCCYGDDGNIITGTNGGTADLIAPTNWKTTPVHFLVDLVPWFLCCSYLASPYKACSQYISHRPVDDCSEWPTGPPPARMFGDPHIITLDGYLYTFNGKGEFILVESLDQSFLLQGRMTEPLQLSNGTSFGGTLFTALAMKQDRSPTIQVEVANEKLLIFVDGEVLDFAGVTEQRIDNVTIMKEGNDTFTIRITSGVSLQASNRNGILTDILVTLPEHLATEGLLGQNNGDPSDDLLPKSATESLLINSSASDIYYKFGLTWIVSDPHSSLFTYGPDRDWDSFYNVNYVPAFEASFSSHELEQQANETCGNNKLCIFDIAATGDVAIGISTMESLKEYEKLKELFLPRSCTPPCVHGACVSNNTCSCSEGFKGLFCDIKVSEDCKNNICANGATCKVLAGDYICECLQEYTGVFCETKAEVSLKSDSSPAPAPVGAVVGGSVGGVVIVALCIFVIIAIVLCAISIQRKKTLPTQEKVELREKSEAKNTFQEPEKS